LRWFAPSADYQILVKEVRECEENEGAKVALWEYAVMGN
jgi:hypothetical protein